MPYKPPPRVSAQRGPWKGVFDTAPPTGGDASYVRDAHNVMPGLEGEWKGRPGWTQLATPPNSGPAQAIAGLTFAPGDDRTMAVVGGKLLRYNWTANTWTDVTPAGKVIAQPGRVALVVFAGKLVVSDGVNPPWTWDPYAGTPTATTIAWASGAWYGPPVVYYAKLFAILASTRNAIEWSEEQSLTQGGTVGGFNNGWNLIQTSQDPLVALAATNEALYFWRTVSAGRILGAVTPTFQSDGVRDAVSPLHGCCSPWAVVTMPGALWWLNQRGRLTRYAAGVGATEMWAPMDGALRILNMNDITRSWLAHVPDVGALALALPRPDFDDLLLVACDGQGAGTYWGEWSHAEALETEFAMAAECVDDTATRRFVHLTPAGVPYVQSLDREDVGVDTYTTTAVAALRAPERRATAYAPQSAAPGVGSTTPAGQRRTVALVGPRPGMLQATPLLPVPEVAVECQPLDGGSPRASVRWDLVTLEAGLPGATTGTAITATLAPLTPSNASGAYTARALTVPSAGKLTVGRAAEGRLVTLRVAGDAETRPQPATQPRFRFWRATADGTHAGDTPTAG